MGTPSEAFTTDELAGCAKGIRHVKNRTRFRNIDTPQNWTITRTRRLRDRREPVRAAQDSYFPHSTPAQVLTSSLYSTTQRAAFHSLRVFPIRASVRKPGAGAWCAT